MLYDFEALHVTNLAPGKDLFDEWDHVVTNSGSLVAERLGYVTALGKNDLIKVGRWQT